MNLFLRQKCMDCCALSREHAQALYCLDYEIQHLKAALCMTCIYPIIPFLDRFTNSFSVSHMNVLHVRICTIPSLDHLMRSLILEEIYFYKQSLIVVAMTNRK